MTDFVVDEDGVVRFAYEDLLSAGSSASTVPMALASIGLMSSTAITVGAGLLTFLNKKRDKKTTDTENICRIIEVGRANDARKIHIEMDSDTSVGLNLTGVEGVDVTIGVKNKKRSVLTIEYKE